MIHEIVAAVLSSPDFLLLALILTVVALVQGAKALWRLLEWLEKTLRSASRRLGALALLCVAVEASSCALTNPVGHLLAILLTLLAWGRWRSNRVI